jgi:LAO/AO transport system kinase
MNNNDRLIHWKNLRRQQKSLRTSEYLLPLLKSGDKTALSAAITLTESSLAQDKLESKKLLQAILPHTGRSKRIGITGVPGVGKSSFIEVFGKHLIDAGYKLAVLAIDPTSNVTGGSILGDKTRMNWLSQQPDVFIRPQAASDQLGGVAKSTKECMLLCEAAGYDFVIIETVGVGQSETSVHDMVDFFLLLMLSGAGDELQGMKRGIMEMADAIVITKADGNNIQQAKRARTQYANALHLFPAKKSDWIPKAMTCSSLENHGLHEVLGMIESYFLQTSTNGWLEVLRKNQEKKVFEKHINELFQNFIVSNENLKELKKTLSEQVSLGELSGYQAAEFFFESIHKI